MATNYKQNDSKWAYNSYAGGTMANSGCGPTAVACLLNKSPVEIANWMTNHGYASNGSGTYWEGIEAALDAYGEDGSQLNYNSLLGTTNSGVFETFKKSIQSGNMGILLMGAGIANYWTNSGHYIAVVGYDDKTDKYLVYDPATTARDGWHGFGDFLGNIKVCYTSSVKWKEATPTVHNFNLKELKYGDKGSQVLLLREILNARGIKGADKKVLSVGYEFDSNTKNAVKRYQVLRNFTKNGIVTEKLWHDLLGF